MRGRFRGVCREKRVCLVCHSGVVEDDEHFIDCCDSLVDVREEMWLVMERMMHTNMKYRIRMMTKEERVDWILGSEPITR